MSIELGEGYEPTERLAAAIGELAEAIQEAHGEVQGFGFSGGLGGITSLQASWSPTSPLDFGAWTSVPAPTPSPEPRSLRRG